MNENPTAAQIVGQRVRHHREELGLSRKKLASLSGVDESHLARIETGSGNPTLIKLIQISAALGSSASDLIEGLGREHLPVSSTLPISEAEVIAELRRRLAQQDSDAV